MKYYSVFIWSILIMGMFACSPEDTMTDDCERLTEGWSVTTTQYPENSFAPTDINILNSGYGHMVSSAGKLLLTRDYGQSWELGELNLIDFITPFGETQYKLNSSYQANELEFFVAIQKFGSDRRSYILYSEDGALNWKTHTFQRDVIIQDIYFKNKYEGVALIQEYKDNTLVKQIHRTINLGSSWEPLNIEFNRIYSERFIETGTSTYLLAQAINGRSVLLRSNSTRLQWEPLVLPFNLKDPDHIYFLNDLEAIIWNGTGAAYYTKDGGTQWEPYELPVLNEFAVMQFENRSTAVIIEPYFRNRNEDDSPTDYYRVYETSDAGRNWKITEISGKCERHGLPYRIDDKTFIVLRNKIHLFRKE